MLRVDIYFCIQIDLMTETNVECTRCNKCTHCNECHNCCACDECEDSYRLNSCNMCLCCIGCIECNYCVFCGKIDKNKVYFGCYKSNNLQFCDVCRY